jgi:hypothetical protein
MFSICRGKHKSSEKNFKINTKNCKCAVLTKTADQNELLQQFIDKMHRILFEDQCSMQIALVM